MWRQIQLPNGALFDVELARAEDRCTARAFGPVRNGERPAECSAEAAGSTFDAAEAQLRKALERGFR